MKTLKINDLIDKYFDAENGIWSQQIFETITVGSIFPRINVGISTESGKPVETFSDQNRLLNVSYEYGVD